MRKSLSGIVAVVVLLGCWSQSEAGDGTSAKLMADRGVVQAAEWILYEELPEDGEIVSFNKVGDDGVEFQVCQSEDGDIGIVSQMQGGAVCDTREGAEDSFYVLYLGDEADDEDDADDEAGGGLAQKMQKKMGSRSGNRMLPDFDWTEDEQEEIREALEDTGAWERFLEESDDDGRRGMDGSSSK